MEEKAKAARSERKDAARKLRAEANKALRLVEGDLPLEERGYLETLLVLDGIWLEFKDSHDYLARMLATLDTTRTTSAQTLAFTNGKDMQSYFEEIETVYNEAVKKLKAKLVEIREMQKLAKTRMEKYTAEREVKDKTRSLQKAWRRIGDKALEELESLKNWTPEEVTELRIKLDDSSEALTQLNLAVERLVALDQSSVHELIEQSQDMALIMGDKIDEVYFALEVSQQTRYPQTPDRRRPPPPTAGLQPLPSASDHPQPPSAARLPRPHEEVFSSATGSPGSHKIKMRAFDFPKFTGKRAEWASFLNTWKNIIEKQGFSNFVLAHQLKLAVKGGYGEKVLMALEVRNEESYGLMMDRLNEYYGDSGALVDSLHQELDGLKSVTDDDPHRIVDFANKVELIYARLESISTDLTRSVAVYQVDRVIARLPAEVRSIWRREFHDLDPIDKRSPFQVLVKFLRKERAVRLRYLDDGQRPDKRVSSHSTESSSNKMTESNSSKKTQHCLMDASHTGHWTQRCQDWIDMSPQERRARCLREKICIMCLGEYKR